MKNLIRIAGIALAATIAAWAVISTAWAHAHPISTTPSAGQVVQVSPPSVLITFSSEIQKFAGTYSLYVKNDSGQSVSAGAPHIDAQDAAKLSIALQSSLPEGRYVVTWSNVDSADGDAASGSFSFYVNMQPTADDLAKDAALDSGAEEPAMPDASAPDMPASPDMMPAMPASQHTDAATPSGPAEPPATGLIVIAMDAQNGSGIDGRAEIIPVDGGAKTQVGVYLNGVADSSMHMAMVHAGSACEGGSHVADLNDIVAAGTPHGGSVTVVDVPFSTMANGKNAILAHGDGGSVVACGKIPAQPAAASLPKSLPQTGNGGASHGAYSLALFGALVVAGTMALAGGASRARRDG